MFANLRKMDGSVPHLNGSIYFVYIEKRIIFVLPLFIFLWGFALPGTCVPSEEQKQKGS
jgi:hypothetical protein